MCVFPSGDPKTVESYLNVPIVTPKKDRTVDSHYPCRILLVYLLGTTGTISRSAISPNDPTETCPLVHGACCKPRDIHGELEVFQAECPAAASSSRRKRTNHRLNSWSI